MLNRIASTKNTEARTTELSIAGKMFVYILLQMMKHGELNESSAALIPYNKSIDALLDVLYEHDVVKCCDALDDITEDQSETFIGITPEGLCASIVYLRAAADELRAGHFGKLTWSKRSKFHKALMQYIA